MGRAAKAASSSSSASREMLLETFRIASIVGVGDGRTLLSAGGDRGDRKDLGPTLVRIGIYYLILLGCSCCRCHEDY